MDSSPEEALSNVSTIIVEIHRNSPLSVLTAASKKEDEQRNKERENKNDSEPGDDSVDNSLRDMEIIGTGIGSVAENEDQSKSVDEKENKDIQKKNKGGDRKKNKDSHEAFADSGKVDDSPAESKKLSNSEQNQNDRGENKHVEVKRVNSSDNKQTDNKQMNRNLDQRKEGEQSHKSIQRSKKRPE
jgi:hypothetical protein